MNRLLMLNLFQNKVKQILAQNFPQNQYDDQKNFLNIVISDFYINYVTQSILPLGFLSLCFSDFSCQKKNSNKNWA